MWSGAISEMGILKKILIFSLVGIYAMGELSFDERFDSEKENTNALLRIISSQLEEIYLKISSLEEANRSMAKIADQYKEICYDQTGKIREP